MRGKENRDVVGFGADVGLDRSSLDVGHGSPEIERRRVRFSTEGGRATQP